MERDPAPSLSRVNPTDTALHMACTSCGVPLGFEFCMVLRDESSSSNGI